MVTAARALAVCLFLGLWSLSGACSPELTPEQKALVAELKSDLARIRQEIADVQKDDAQHSDGLVKSLIAIRLEVLRTNAALVEQRLHSLQGGVRPNLVVHTTNPDPERAAELAKDIEAQKEKVSQARREADQYAGGLVQALSETTVATAQNTLAILEQQYVLAKHGLVLPSLPAPTFDKSVTASIVEKQTEKQSVKAPADQPKECLKIESLDSSVLSRNNVFTELAWKVDVTNACDEPFGVRVRFVIYDKEEFELDSDNETVLVPAHGIAKARGKMLVSPPEKAGRMAKQGASISFR